MKPLYAVYTDLLDDDVSGILKVSEGRWQIEECFRIMKTDFSARPVYLGGVCDDEPLVEFFRGIWYVFVIQPGIVFIKRGDVSRLIVGHPLKPLSNPKYIKTAPS